MLSQKKVGGNTRSCLRKTSCYDKSCERIVSRPLENPSLFEKSPQSQKAANTGGNPSLFPCCRLGGRQKKCVNPRSRMFGEKQARSKFFEGPPMSDSNTKVEKIFFLPKVFFLVKSFFCPHFALPFWCPPTLS